MLAKEDVSEFVDLNSYAFIQDNNKPVNLYLYDFNLGSIINSQNTDSKALEANLQFLHLLVQAKFFNGETSYSSKEIPFLKNWIEKNGVEKMEKLFLEIITWKDETKIAFPTSPLNKVFQKIKKTPTISTSDIPTSEPAFSENLFTSTSDVPVSEPTFWENIYNNFLKN